MRGNGASTSWDVETIKAPINAALAGSFDNKSVDFMPVYDFDYIIFGLGTTGVDDNRIDAHLPKLTYKIIFIILLLYSPINIPQSRLGQPNPYASWCM